MHRSATIRFALLRVVAAVAHKRDRLREKMLIARKAFPK
jgi:hypothetical protein